MQYSIWKLFKRPLIWPNRKVFLFPWTWPVLRWGEQNADPIAAVEFLAKYCEWAVVTLGSNGCIARHGKDMIRVSAIGESKATDATGAAPYVLTVNRNQSTHFSTSTVNSIANQASVIREL
ncbi:unnamed protein product [Vicia faba]|uniref:Uncharacterized protein n=1 Tax=Vicia faba TaxID=3906 RepID=A0AAV0ZH49_VICFA|nr:unnamed protein product [Vicia faba]